MFPSVYGVVSQQSAANWWEAGGAHAPVAAYQPIGAASLAASYVNLANPGTYDAAPGVAPTWDAATGWTFNGSTQYLDAGGLAPNGTWSLIIRYTDYASSFTALVGMIRGANRLSIDPNSAGAVRWYNPSLVSVAPPFLTGVAAIAGTVAYRNGLSDATLIGGNYLSHRLFIGAINNDSALGNPASYSNVKIQAVAIYNTTLTAAQVLSVSTAMAAL